MDEYKTLKYGLLTLGSLLVATSFTLVGRYAFQGSVFNVFAGYLVFVAGYKACWYGVHQEGGFDKLRAALTEGFQESLDFVETNPVNYILIAVGVYSAAFGTVAFTVMIENPSIHQAILSGATSFGGYVMAHEGVNEVPL
jgi:hypothetical protein